MYQSIKETISDVIKQYEADYPIKDDVNGVRNHYFIEGMRVALQLINQVEEINTDELAYETFEDTVKALKDNLEREDMEEIIEDVFTDKEED